MGNLEFTLVEKPPDGHEILSDRAIDALCRFIIGIDCENEDTYIDGVNAVETEQTTN